MVAVAGFTGLVDGVCSSVKSWTVTLTREALEATNFCSGGWRTFVAGLQGGTGTLTSTERFTGSSSITLTNSELALSISGDVIFTEEVITNDVEGIVEYENSFTFTGPVAVA